MPIQLFKYLFPFLFLVPVLAYAQIVPAQNQQIIAPYGGWIVATSSNGVSKLSASTTPFFSSFFATNGSINTLTVGTCTGCGSSSSSFGTSSLSALFPILYTQSSSLAQFSFLGLTTTTPWTTSGIAWRVNDNTIATVATGTVSGAGGISVTAGQSVIGSGLTISCASCALFGFPFTPAIYGTQAVNATSTGMWFTGSPLSVIASSTFSTFSSSTQSSIASNFWLPALTSGTLNVDGAGLVYKTATSTPTVTAPITYSGTLGQFIGGISGTFDCTAANGTTKGCLTGADWTIFNNKISSSSLSQIFPFTPATNFATNTNATTTPLWFQQGFMSSTTGYVTNLDFYPPTSTLVSFRGQTFIKATTTGSSMSIGINAGLNQSTGVNNFFAGPNAGRTTTSGGNNVYIGFNAGFDGNVNNNVGIGSNALASSSAGSGNNTAFGTDALSSNTTGNTNVALGRGAMDDNTTGSGNVGIGDVALAHNLTSSGNTAIGQGALNSTTGQENLAIGQLAASTLTSGYGNMAIGYTAASELTTGLGNLIVGNYAHATSSTASNFLNIGGLVFGKLPATSTVFAEPSFSSAGAVGIASSSPWRRLGVNGSGVFTGALSVGSSSLEVPTVFQNHLFDVFGNINGYTGINFGNLSAGTSASTDIVFFNNKTMTSTYYADCGMNGGAYNDSTYGNLNQANGFYCYNTDGVLQFYTATTTVGSGYISFGTGGYTNERMRIDESGRVGIGSTTPWGILSVKGDGVTPYLEVGNTSNNPVFSITSAGRVIVGVGTSSASTYRAGSLVIPSFEIMGSLSGQSSYLMYRFSADANPGRIYLMKGRGTTFSDYTAIASGDDLGEFSFSGTNGSTASEGARITVTSDATPSLGDNFVSADIKFQTSDAGATISPKMTIDSSGNVTLAGTAPTASSCGTSPTVRTGSAGNAGMVIIGSGAISACTLTFDTAYSRAPSCVASFNLAAATSTVLVASTTASTLVLRGSTSNMGGGYVNYLCFGI